MNKGRVGVKKYRTATACGICVTAMTILFAGYPVGLFADTHAFLTNQQDNTVSVVNTKTRQNIRTIPVGKEPAGVAVSDKWRRAWITQPGDGKVQELDCHGVTRSLAVGDGPLAIVVDSARDLLYVADWYSHEIVAIDLHQFKITKSIAVGRAPSGLVMGQQSQYLYVSNRDDNNIMQIDLQRFSVTATADTGDKPFGITIDTTRNRLYSANVKSNSVSVVDLSNMKTIAELAVGERPYDVAVAADMIFVTNQDDNTVSSIAAAELKVIAEIEVGEYPEGIDTHPDGQQIYVANWFDNSVSIINVEQLTVVETIDTGDGTRAYGDLFLKSCES